MLFLPACEVVWDSGGMRHAVGVGYLSWPVAPPGVAPVAYGTDVLGAALLYTQEEAGLVLGYSSGRFVTVPENDALELDCLQCDLAGANARRPDLLTGTDAAP